MTSGRVRNGARVLTAGKRADRSGSRPPSPGERVDRIVPTPASASHQSRLLSQGAHAVNSQDGLGQDRATALGVSSQPVPVNAVAPPSSLVAEATSTP